MRIGELISFVDLPSEDRTIIGERKIVGWAEEGVIRCIHSMGWHVGWRGPAPLDDPGYFEVWHKASRTVWIDRGQGSGTAPAWYLLVQVLFDMPQWTTPAARILKYTEPGRHSRQVRVQYTALCDALADGKVSTQSLLDKA